MVLTDRPNMVCDTSKVELFVHRFVSGKRDWEKILVSTELTITLVGVIVTGVATESNSDFSTIFELNKSSISKSNSSVFAPNMKTKRRKINTKLLLSDEAKKNSL